MALQPAAGARDLNPQQVEKNQRLSSRLAEIYRLWGYEEVSPPRIEHIDTLTAGGAISSKEIVKIVADDPLGLRPEMTASITRAACTRLANRPRPLRLWAQGTTFERKVAAEGGLSIEEKLKSGVEMIGEETTEAEMELVSLLLSAFEVLDLSPETEPTLLIGHTKLMDLVISKFDRETKDNIRKALIEFNNIDLEFLLSNTEEVKFIQKVLDSRNTPNKSIDSLNELFGAKKVIEDLERLLTQINGLSQELNVKIILDPTFQPHFELYNGIVFQLICKGEASPIVIASGGRYDGLVDKFRTNTNDIGGVGFSFSIDDIRELKSQNPEPRVNPEKILIAYNDGNDMGKAFKKQKEFHKKGIQAVLELKACKNLNEAKTLMISRGCTKVEWI